MIVYLDSSAVVPLFTEEETSEAPSSYREDLLTDYHPLVKDILGGFSNIEHTTSQYKSARALGRPNLRSLDALHIATALDVGAQAMITLDKRMVESCDVVGLPCLDTYRPREYPRR